MPDQSRSSASASFEAPHPGSKNMPRWTTGELIDAPRFTKQSLLAMIGPGLVMGASAIGGGEWLAGPAVTAKYGAALLWVATVSILVQVLYNIEISRYTLYTGEPIFTGKFRIPPHPMFWLMFYLLLDWGAIFPYLVVNAAVTLEKMFILNFEPETTHWLLHKLVSTGIFFLCVFPLLIGGKIFNSLKVIMSAKLVIVIGFLLFVSAVYSRPSHWMEIASGLFKVGTVPITQGEDRNNNGVLDPGEDFDGDGHLDVVEKQLPKTVDTDGDGKPDAWEKDSLGRPHKFVDEDGDGKADGANIDNFVISFLTEGRWPNVDWSLIGFIAGLAAIAGNGGLTNTPISNFTRDQGWGMGHHVGAIPSIVGGHGIELSHVGCVFQVTEESLPRWKRWYRHVARDQICVWMMACLIGVSLPSILSIGFLPRGTEAPDDVAAMTSVGVAKTVLAPNSGTLAALPAFAWMTGSSWAESLRIGTLFCGFLVLMTSMISTVDGFVRRWVDVCWTALPRLRELDTRFIKYVYFFVLLAYSICCMSIIWAAGSKPSKVFQLATTGYNFAFAFSCWHTIFINTKLLPRELRPNMVIRVLMALGSVYFAFLGVMGVLKFAGVV